jgi:3-phenylpropionate/trans-cinnamate dioxygenase ferredoxin reductase component
MTDQRTFVIVGASLTGARAAQELRESGFDGRLILIGQETERPYERPPLSKGYLSGRDARDSAFVHDQSWYADHRVELRLGVRVTSLNSGAHTVICDDGAEIGYDRLLLATGSRPRRLDVAGADLAGAMSLRTLADSDALRERLTDVGRVVIVGGGWIGLETAAAARRHGAEVTVVELDQLPLRRVLGDEVAAAFADVHRRHGVRFRFGVGVREFRGEDGRLSSVVLSDGSTVPADLAIVGVGIVPNIEVGESGGLEVNDGIVTDQTHKTSVPDVYAAGDVANSYNPSLGRHVRVEHWANALNGGKSAARSMLDHDEVYDRTPYFFSDQYDSTPSIGMEYSGWVAPGGYDQVVFRGDASISASRDPEFLAFWVKDGRVLAGMNVNIWDVQDDIQALVRSGKPVDLAKLADPGMPLADLM